MSHCRLESSFRSHPKLNRLARRLGIDPVLARGHVAILWSWCVELAPDGDLSSFEPEDIEEAACWGGEAGAFFAALVGVRLVDRVKTEDGSEHYEIHEWMDRADGWKAAERQRRSRAERKAAESVTASRPKRDSNVGADQIRTSRSDQSRAEDLVPRPKSAATPEPPDDTPAVVTFPATGGAGEWALTERAVAELGEAFPAVDVVAEARVALAWVRADPTRRKTVRGYPRFITSWLTRAIDKGRFRARAGPHNDHPTLSERGARTMRNAQTWLAGAAEKEDQHATGDD